jgi:uncharacterized YigZ family protein
MSDATRYPVPAARHRAEQSIDRSRFICTVQRVSTAADAQAFVREMNAGFPDATHNCWAFVAGPPGSTNQVGMSDDGEPHGTAGRPMLTVLLHAGIGEIAAVVTRYYGGTKLGTGGLVKAYGGTVQLALGALPTIERVDYVDATVTIGYSSVTVVQQLLESVEALVLTQDYGVHVRYVLRVPRPSVGQLRAQLADATRGEAQMEVAGEL